MKGLISVVIPVYNVEKYLRECLDSVINQTYKNLEIILVDDGSTDGSGKICDEYAAKDNRITVVHQKNAGAGAAKNTGLDLVMGEYLSLIDSDDYIEKNMYQVMIDQMKRKSADIVQCLFDNVFVNESVNRQFFFRCNKYRSFTSTRYLYEMLFDWKYAIFWNKLFKSSLLKDIRFPVGRKIDDEFFTYKLICNSKKIINISDCFYHYRMRKSSVMNGNDYRLLVDRMDCFKERYWYISDKCSRLEKYLYKHYLEYLLDCRKYTNDKSLANIIEKEIEKLPARKFNVLEELMNKFLLRNFIHEDVKFPENKEYFI